jgi:hypothetical protein
MSKMVLSICIDDCDAGDDQYVVDGDSGDSTLILFGEVGAIIESGTSAVVCDVPGIMSVLQQVSNKRQLAVMTASEFNNGSRSRAVFCTNVSMW